MVIRLWAQIRFIARAGCKVQRGNGDSLLTGRQTDREGTVRVDGTAFRLNKHLGGLGRRTHGRGQRNNKRHALLVKRTKEGAGGRLHIVRTSFHRFFFAFRATPPAPGRQTWRRGQRPGPHSLPPPPGTTATTTRRWRPTGE